MTFKFFLTFPANDDRLRAEGSRVESVSSGLEGPLEDPLEAIEWRNLLVENPVPELLRD